MNDGLLYPSLAKERVSQVALHRGDLRSNLKGLFVMFDSTIKSILLEQGIAEAVLCDVILGSVIDGVLPQSVAILPVGRFAVREHHHRRDQERGGCDQRFAAARPFRGQLDRTPRHQDGQTNLRQVGVTIGS